MSATESAGMLSAEGAAPQPTLSAVVVAHNEAAQLADCLSCLSFADEIVVLLDRCTDGSREIVGRFADRVIEGAWVREAPRRLAAIAACRGPGGPWQLTMYSPWLACTSMSISSTRRSPSVHTESNRITCTSWMRDVRGGAKTSSL